MFFNMFFNWMVLPLTTHPVFRYSVRLILTTSKQIANAVNESRYSIKQHQLPQAHCSQINIFITFVPPNNIRITMTSPRTSAAAGGGDSTTLDQLEPIAIFGFDGKVAGGLCVHPDREHVVFPLGNRVSILNVDTNRQTTLIGHTNSVSIIDVSKSYVFPFAFIFKIQTIGNVFSVSSGALIASGQINNMGYRAYVIVWDWETKKELFRHEMHRGRVQALCFTSNELCLISLGGCDDGMLIVWDVVKKFACM